MPLLPQNSAVNNRHVCLSRLLNAVTVSQLDYTSHIPIVTKTEKRTDSDRMHKLYATDVCDVYVGGKVRVSEFMIILTLQHWGSK